VRESLTIAGWVGMWRPLEIFLYEWWPLINRRRTYHNLGRAHVRVLERSARPAARPAGAGDATVQAKGS
jgi:hypothetical protein